MQVLNFYKNQNNYFQVLEMKEFQVLHSRFSKFEVQAFENSEDAISFFNLKDKEILKEGLKKIEMEFVQIPSKLNSFDEVIACFNLILEKNALLSLFDFLKLIDKTTKGPFVKELKLYRKYLSEFEENKKGNWSRKGSDIQIDIVAMSAMSLMNKTDITSWTEVYSLLRNVQFSYVENLLNHFNPSWLGSFILDRTLKTEWGRIDYQQLIYLEEKGYLDYNQELNALCISEISFWEYKSVSDVNFLFNNKKTYQRDIPLLFEYPTNLNNATTKYIEGKKKEKAWILIFILLIDQSKLDRFFVLEKCIDIQLKNWNNGQLSFFRELLEELKPTNEELIKLQNQLFLLIPIANKMVYNFAIKHIKKIAVEDQFNKEELIEWSSTILSNFDAKTSIISVLQIFDKFLKKFPKLQSNILQLKQTLFVVLRNHL